MRWLVASLLIVACGNKAPWPASMADVSVKSSVPGKIEVHTQLLGDDGKAFQPQVGTFRWELWWVGDAQCEADVPATFSATHDVTISVELDSCTPPLDDSQLKHLELRLRYVAKGKEPVEGTGYFDATVAFTGSKLRVAAPVVAAAVPVDAAPGGPKMTDADLDVYAKQMAELAAIVPASPAGSASCPLSEIHKLKTLGTAATRVDYALMTTIFAGGQLPSDDRAFAFLNDGATNTVAQVLADPPRRRDTHTMARVLAGLWPVQPLVIVYRASLRSAPAYANATLFHPGLFDGAMVYIDSASKKVLCSLPLRATSSEKVTQKTGASDAVQSDFETRFNEANEKVLQDAYLSESSFGGR